MSLRRITRLHTVRWTPEATIRGAEFLDVFEAGVAELRRRIAELATGTALSRAAAQERLRTMTVQAAMHLRPAALSVLVAALAAVDGPPAPTALDESWKQVTVADGIDGGEAVRIANAYLWTHISGCGGVMEVIEAGDAWTAVPLVGRGAQPGAPVRIEKRTGIVTCPKGPRIVPPASVGDAAR